jgi:energy-converting hydrogenase Eha subunit A
MIYRKSFFKILGKSALLALFIFWLIVLSKDIEEVSLVIFLMVISFIPIFIISSIVIIATVVPFFILNPNLSTEETIKLYFPYYAIAAFIAIVYFTFLGYSDIYTVAFNASAFVTLMQAWVWIYNLEKDD